MGSVRRMQGELPPDEAAEAYEEDLRRFFGAVDLPRFDLILLGTGGEWREYIDLEHDVCYAPVLC